MSVHGIGHVNLRAAAETIERLRRFYVDVIGLREGPRPEFRSASRGHWLYAGENAVLHLTMAATGGATAQSPGVFNHLAFDCDDLDAVRARLDDAGVAYETDVVDELGQTQLFLTDPAGIGVELTFTNRQRTPE
ncbi:MAG TPA: VOC family protein [Rhodanobacteraceae bacterium]|nr:VOC family protein [Rhodanobacteraceae bacterium]